MGWFDTDSEHTLYSDETLDLAYNFIKEFSKIYQNDLQRKPTIEELEYLLRVSFRVNLDSIFLADFKEKKLDDIKFKIGKRKKTLKYEVGDMCTIPLSCGGYAFARIIIMQPPSWYLSEIFAYYSKDKTFRPNIEESGYLLYPMFIMPNYFNNWESDIIHQIPGYISPHLSELHYCFGSLGNYYLVKAGENHKDHPISDKEAKKYEKMTIFHPSKIIKIIENSLREKGLLF